MTLGQSLVLMGLFVKMGRGSTAYHHEFLHKRWDINVINFINKFLGGFLRDHDSRALKVKNGTFPGKFQ